MNEHDTGCGCPHSTGRYVDSNEETSLSTTTVLAVLGLLFIVAVTAHTKEERPAEGRAA